MNYIPEIDKKYIEFQKNNKTKAEFVIIPAKIYKEFEYWCNKSMGNVNKSCLNYRFLGLKIAVSNVDEITIK